MYVRMYRENVLVEKVIGLFTDGLIVYYVHAMKRIEKSDQITVQMIN